MDIGWIKLHRELLDKAIWGCSTPEQKVVLITLLISVNYEPKQWEWKGEKCEIKPGQLITSIDSLAKLCGNGISVKNVRTALKRFENYGFLTIETANTGSLITINNWEIFQGEDRKKASEQESKWQTSGKDMANERQATGKQVANTGQTYGKRVATTKEIKKDKKDKKDNNIYNNPHFRLLWDAYPRKKDKGLAYKAYNARLNDGYSEDELLKAVEKYAEECRREKKEQKYIKYCATFLGPNTPFEDYLVDSTAEIQSSPRTSQEQYEALLRQGGI